MTFDEYLFENVDYEKYGLMPPDQLCETYFPPKTKIYIVGDKDPWYIVGYQDDEIKEGIFEKLVTYRSWAKYKQRWVYKIETFDMFLLDQESVAPKHYAKNGKFNLFLTKLRTLK